MWAWGDLLAAVEVPGGSNDSLIAMVGGVIVAALGTLGLVLTEILKGRNSRTTASPPAPTTGSSKDVELYERTAVLSNRADDSDRRHNLLERTVHQHHEEEGERLERLERHLGIYEEGGHH